MMTSEEIPHVRTWKHEEYDDGFKELWVSFDNRMTLEAKEWPDEDALTYYGVGAPGIPGFEAVLHEDRVFEGVDAIASHLKQILREADSLDELPDNEGPFSCRELARLLRTFGDEVREAAETHYDVGSSSEQVGFDEFEVVDDD